MKKKIIPVSGGIDSAYLVARAINDGHEVHMVYFDDGDNEHSEARAAHNVISHYLFNSLMSNAVPNVFARALAIPKLSLLSVKYDIQYQSDRQREAMVDIDYWSGYKALMYSTTLAYGGAIGADAIEFGVYDWNDHFADEIPDNARAFEATWRTLYPDLKIPSIEFPLMGRTKYNILLDAKELGVPLGKTYSCFKDNGPCGTCMGCTHRAEEFAAAGIIDPTAGGKHAHK